MLNICLISYEFPPMVGGEGIYTYILAKALSELGHYVTVITTEIKSEIKYSQENKFSIIRVPIIKGLKLYSFNIKANKKIVEIFNNQKVDILHYTNDFVHLTASKKFGIPIIATIHHPWFAERKNFQKNKNFIEYLKYVYSKKIFYLEWLEKKICKNSDKIIAVSNFTANSIKKEYQIPPNRITVIPNTVNTKKFDPNIDGQEIRKKFNLLSDHVILYVGTLDYQKGVDYLIRSFINVIKEIPNSKLVIVGDGPIKRSIKNLINKLGLEKFIILVGRVTDKDLPKFYAASNLVVLPSLMEGFGIVLLEAMAMEKPCIATKVGGTEDVIINNESGLIVPPANPFSLFQAIYTVLSDDDLSVRFGRAGRKRVLENFTIDKMARRTLNVYEEALKNDF